MSGWERVSNGQQLHLGECVQRVFTTMFRPSPTGTLSSMSLSEPVASLLLPTTPSHATAAHCVCVGVCGQMPVIVRALLAASTAEPVCVKLAEAPARPGLTTSRGEPSKQTHPPARFTKLDGEGDGAGEAQVAQD